MLWRNRGLKALLSNRCQRILLPLTIGMFTIVPAVWAVSAIASRSGYASPASDKSAALNTAVNAGGLQLLEAAVRGG